MQAVRRWIPVGILAAAFALIAALITAPNAADAADHLDAPGLTSPGGEGALDINDLYVFEGSASNRTAIAVTVAPAADEYAQFAPGSRHSYSIRIDQDGDAVEDLTYNFRFFGPFFGKQLVVAQRATGDAAQSTAPVGSLYKLALTDRSVRAPGGGELFTGLRSDPFFFDLSGFLGTVEGADNGDALGNNPTDFFTDLNTLAIVIEMRDAKLFDGDAIGVWATTQQRNAGEWSQVDRIGRPAINTVVNSSGPIVGADPNAKNVYNAGHPKDDAAFTQGVVDALLAFSALDSEGPYTVAQAEALAGVLLPDVLTYDKSSPLPAPLNGRALADDVIDTELRIVTGGDPLGLFGDRDADGGVNSDGVGPHADYLDVFPYLGTPH